MSVCHLHVLITNRTEEMPRSVSGMGTEHITHQHLHQLAREQRGHTVTAQPGSQQLCVPDRSSTSGTCKCRGQALEGGYWGKQGEIRWDNQLQYLKACD